MIASPTSKTQNHTLISHVKVFDWDFKTEFHAHDIDAHINMLQQLVLYLDNLGESNLTAGQLGQVL